MMTSEASRCFQQAEHYRLSISAARLSLLVLTGSKRPDPNLMCGFMESRTCSNRRWIKLYVDATYTTKIQFEVHHQTVDFAW